MLRNRRPALPTLSIFLRLAISLSICLGLLLESASAAVESPKPEGWVTDRAGFLDVTTRNQLERLLAEVERKSGVEIAVVTLPTLAGRSVEEVAVELFQAWGIGKKGKDEGVLLLVARNERKIRIEVGYGLEGTIPDGLAGEIIRDTITPRFRQGRFAEGIETGVRQIVGTVAKQKQIDLAKPPVPPARPTPTSSLRPYEQRLVYKATIFFVLLLVILIGLALASERSFRRQRGRRRFQNRFLGFPVAPRGGGWSGGGFGSGDSGGFGGFGGGSSGGGGASGGW